MKATYFRRVICFATVLMALCVFQGLIAAVDAADIKNMLKQVNKELRQANRDMFSGKSEKAIAALEPIRETLIQAKQIDPNNPMIKGYENKYRKLVKDLERRTGKDLGGGTLTAAASSTKTQLAPKPAAKPLPEKEAASPAPARGETGSQPAPVKEKVGKTAEGTAKLPYNARRPIEMAERDLQRVDRSAQKLSNPKWDRDQLLKNMSKSLESARKNLESGKAEAAKKGVTAYPRFDELEAGISDAEKKIAEATKQVAQSEAKAAVNAGEATGDVEALKATYDQAQPVFEKATGSVIYYNDLGSAKILIEQIEAFEKNDLANIRQQMKAFGEKYGTTRDEIDQKADEMGYVNTYYRASFPYTELRKGIENIEKTRTVMADDLVRRAEEMKRLTAKGIHDFARLKQHARIKAWGEMAARFDPDNPRVKAFNDEIDAWVAADARALNAKIDKATFPRQAQDAPRDAEKLAKEAKLFLQKEEERLAGEKGKEVSRVLRVVVTGPWRVFKKNLLGEPIQYNLPIATAVQTESEKKQNLARVYLSTMLTQEMKGVKKAPPYLGATVGDSYYIRPSAVK
ncbi:MAG: hypothetical protein U5R49_04010 [Deltaproteobacteria bacterium]|nr:hypothetical protein [Deltaproteobacteria bacterium]